MNASRLSHHASQLELKEKMKAVRPFSDLTAVHFSAPRESFWNVTKDCNTTSPHCHHGTSPKIVAHGKHLSYLDLSGINFQLSPILAFLGSMTQLRHYYLSGALLSGVVPHDHGNLSSLNVLDLGGAETLDAIPPVVVDDLMWVSRLSLLENLNMSYVDLSPTKDLLVGWYWRRF
ncbi:hypothetical protein RD792_003655 [Penstemon davidsonii]|uniref:Uncharacterized protein n=1 Tax=Penstemon davidsonii TaxID=160366 RepID=A0ABR0DFA5_9LAMI|nr:hypothetical protein RD792_003655 [Penstemon davidsonii]